ncbi:hypothetical protein RM392_001075 [Enterobacter cloacae]|nr:hypothetical protein [Enterobacter cloacae]
MSIVSNGMLLVQDQDRVLCKFPGHKVIAGSNFFHQLNKNFLSAGLIRKGHEYGMPGIMHNQRTDGIGR